ncbi:peptide ABC transporter substrate-binding protein [Bordetella trematum]|uniref:Extracellular substrate-binding protein,family 5 n=1 Tax=Bordetella trematum TaxID=123899 RepID=A0A157PCG3_9BORD|nr:ABC transporter substrate-binding protein [Bordetella trematum]AZR92772.1 peptide ABC transporter substrate-binding protein [Bordetella trematum]NNH18018.1 ABC transporter substrate-binding protein [Bordetella trematum]SAI30579.1 extracellular substrate-binding protein%2Cfamily 5 [Bordetella trematum]SAI69330.1 extracellular substrate-binding protein%2Cfamily 5 [Bordetella trematum]SUV99290.1 extracellular substrate-binding protein,family 5 [Bordetella trematum]
MCNTVRRALLQGALAAAALLSTATASAADPQPQYGGVLTAILNPEPPNLNVALQQVGTTQMVAGKIYESLLTYSFDLKPQPSLAKSWEVSPDQLTYTFHLQPNVSWHDGKPFSADDVVFTYTKVLANTPRTRTLMANVESVTAPDPQTVVFRLKQPYSAFLYAFDIGGGVILPKHLYDVDTPMAQNPHNNAPVGTGPFKFKHWERGSYIELVKNPAYWKEGRPYLDGITYRVIPDAASRRLALEQGTVQQAWLQDIEPFDIPRVSKLPHINTTQKGFEYWSTMHWIELNGARKPMDDKRFRQAIMYALNRDFITEKIMFGMGTVATGPLHHNTRFYDANVKRYPYDPEKAIALLDEMGLKPDAKGVRVRLGLIPNPYGEMQRRIAEYTKQNLGKVGIEVNIENTDVGGWTTRMGNWDFDMAYNGVFQYGDPAIGVSRTYVSSNIKKGLPFTNTSQYSNPKVDELFEQASRATSDEERQKLYTEVQQILVEDVPLAWINDTNYSIFLDKRVHDAVTTGLGAVDTYADAWMSK